MKLHWHVKYSILLAFAIKIILAKIANNDLINRQSKASNRHDIAMNKHDSGHHPKEEEFVNLEAGTNIVGDLKPNGMDNIGAITGGVGPNINGIGANTGGKPGSIGNVWSNGANNAKVSKGVAQLNEIANSLYGFGKGDSILISGIKGLGHNGAIGIPGSNPKGIGINGVDDNGVIWNQAGNVRTPVVKGSVGKGSDGNVQWVTGGDLIGPINGGNIAWTPGNDVNGVDENIPQPGNKKPGAKGSAAKGIDGNGESVSGGDVNGVKGGNIAWISGKDVKDIGSVGVSVKKQPPNKKPGAKGSGVDGEDVDKSYLEWIPGVDIEGLGIKGPGVNGFGTKGGISVINVVSDNQDGKWHWNPKSGKTWMTTQTAKWIENPRPNWNTPSLPVQTLKAQWTNEPLLLKSSNVILVKNPLTKSDWSQGANTKVNPSSGFNWVTERLPIQSKVNNWVPDVPVKLPSKSIIKGRKQPVQSLDIHLSTQRIPVQSLDMKGTNQIIKNTEGLSIQTGYNVKQPLEMHLATKAIPIKGLVPHSDTKLVTDQIPLQTPTIKVAKVSTLSSSKIETPVTISKAGKTKNPTTKEEIFIPKEITIDLRQPTTTQFTLNIPPGIEIPMEEEEEKLFAKNAVGLEQSTIKLITEKPKGETLIPNGKISSIPNELEEKSIKLRPKWKQIPKKISEQWNLNPIVTKISQQKVTGNWEQIPNTNVWNSEKNSLTCCQIDNTIYHLRPSNSPGVQGLYSSGIVARGLIWISGMIGIKPGTNYLIKGGLKVEFLQILHNIETVLMKAKTDFSCIFEVQIQLLDIQRLQELDDIYQTFFTTPNEPARSVFATSGLPQGAQIQVKIQAMKGTICKHQNF